VYAPSSIEEYERHLNSYQLPEFIVQHFVAIATDYRNGIFQGQDGVIRQITGQAPQTVEEFVRKNREAFEG
jgi:hypothetical protein